MHHSHAVSRCLPARNALLLERINRAPHGDTVMNVQAGALQLATALCLLPHIPQWAGPALLDGHRLTFCLGLAVFFVASDLAEFIYHYAQHHIPFLWRLHALHHSDPEMSVLTTRRHYWADQIIKQITVWSAVLMIITPTPAILIAYGLISLWNMVVHANIKGDLGWWCWFINCPAYHRLHHSRNPRDHGANYAAILPIWDVLLGTYRRPKPNIQTGLPAHPRTSFDLILWPLVWSKTPPSQHFAKGSSAIMSPQSYAAVDDHK